MPILLRSVTGRCLRSRNYINVIVAGKQPELQWLDMDATALHCGARHLEGRLHAWTPDDYRQLELIAVQEDRIFVELQEFSATTITP